MIMFRINTKIRAMFALLCVCLASCVSSSERLVVPADFVWLSYEAPSIVQAMVYAGAQNFVGMSVDGYEAAECILTRQAAEGLQRAQLLAQHKGWSLIVFDCYRPQQAVNHFVRWSGNNDRSTKAEYYPALEKQRLFELGYIAEQSGHSRGSTVDIGLVPLEGERTLADGEGACTQSAQPPVLDFGTRFDCFDPLSNTADPRISPQAKRNRATLLEIMEAAGFRNYAKEWWHFTLKDEPFPNTYFDFPVTLPREPLRQDNG